jgi:hypothetical protein
MFDRRLQRPASSKHERYSWATASELDWSDQRIGSIMNVSTPYASAERPIEHFVSACSKFCQSFNLSFAKANPQDHRRVCFLAASSH